MTIIIIIAAIFGFSKVIRLVKQKNDVQKAMMLAIKAEQIRQANASARAWEKQRAADEKRDAKIRQHDDAIKNLQFRMDQAEKDIMHLRVTLDDLNESFDRACLIAERYHNSGDEVKEEQAKNRVRVLRNQIHATEKKLDKAINDKRVCLSKMEVA